MTIVKNKKEKKTYFGVLCDGVYKSQRGLREEGARTVCYQRRSSFDQRVVREDFSLPQRNTRNNKNKTLNTTDGY